MSINLLTVDDHEIVREYIRRIFFGTEVNVVAEAANGREALERLSQHSVDVALVDIQMPDSDGFEFLERLLTHGGSRPAILMHSSEDAADTVDRCQKLGAQGFIPKGHARSKLLDAIRGVLRGEQCWSYPAPSRDDSTI